MSWWIKFLRLAAVLMLADITEPARKSVCSCSGCDGCTYIDDDHYYASSCATSPAAGAYYCAACAKAGGL